MGNTKIKSLIIAFILLAFSSTACIKYNSRITVYSDGTATANVKVAGPAGITEEFEKNLTGDPMCEVKRTHDDDSYSDTLNVNFKRVELEKLDLQNSLSPTVIKEKGIFCDAYTLDCWSPRVITESDKNLETINSIYKVLQMNGSINWSISLPCRPAAHNAEFTENDGKILIWTASILKTKLDKLQYYQDNIDSCNKDEFKAFMDTPIIFASFKLYHYGNIAGAVCIALLLVYLSIMHLRRRKAAQTAQASAACSNHQPTEPKAQTDITVSNPEPIGSAPSSPVDEP